MSDKAKDIIAEVVACILVTGMVVSVVQVIGLFAFALGVVIVSLYLIDLDEREMKNERSDQSTPGGE